MGERRTRGCKCVAAHTTHQMQVGVKEHPQWQTYTGSPTYDYTCEGWPFQASACGCIGQLHGLNMAARGYHTPTPATTRQGAYGVPVVRTISPTHSPTAHNELRPYWQSLDFDLRRLPMRYNIVAAVMM